MKTMICFTILSLMCASITFSQSIVDFQSGTTIVVQPGADICADNLIINGAFSGGGTICGGGFFVLNLSSYIEGFYRPNSDTMIPDTVVIYLRNAVTPFAKLDSAKSVLNSSGIGTFLFLNVSSGTNYYIALKHRNSIETWSNIAVAFSTGTLAYDFTSAADKAYGSNQIQVDSAPLKFAIYSGDVNQDGSINAIDIGLVDNDAFNFVMGYVKSDVNGDNVTNALDLAITDNNAFNFVSKVTPP